MPDFSVRSQQIEIMDDLNCSGEVVDQTLRELETINTMLGGNHVTINGLENLLATWPKDKPVRIVDLGCGGGDMLKRIARWAQKKGYNVKLTGIDANPNIVAYARKNTPKDYPINYEVLDIFSGEFSPRDFDVVVGTLFFHHFSTDQLADFFRKLTSQVSIGIVINDIHRHWFAYYSIRWLTRIFSRSAMVRFDAPLSVLRAFGKEDILEVLRRGEIRNYSLRWMWAFRWQVIIRLN